MYYFCTLFDSSYLIKGITLIRSLSKHAHPFTLWVLCMDTLCFDILHHMNLPNVHLITLEKFEDPLLLNVKQSRTKGEYCWTCTPSLLLYIFRHHKHVDMLSYVDADLFFYTSPRKIYEEFGNKSILIISQKHKYNKHCLNTAFGKFNVGMLVFRNDTNVLTCLNTWRKNCLRWCYKRSENGLYGDQGYVSDWPHQYKKVHILKNPGAGLAYWNIGFHMISKIKNMILVNNSPLIFYHFANFTIPEKLIFPFREYMPSKEISPQSVKLIYQPYINEIRKTIQLVSRYRPISSFGLYPLSTIRMVIRKTKMSIIALFSGQSILSDL
jgi:hypothetical protein